jgi:hypothetical protein
MRTPYELATADAPRSLGIPEGFRFQVDISDPEFQGVTTTIDLTRSRRVIDETAITSLGLFHDRGVELLLMRRQRRDGLLSRLLGNWLGRGR